jgi:hypothetical protein
MVKVLAFYWFTLNISGPKRFEIIGFQLPYTNILTGLLLIIFRIHALLMPTFSFAKYYYQESFQVRQSIKKPVKEQSLIPVKNRLLLFIVVLELLT